MFGIMKRCPSVRTMSRRVRELTGQLIFVLISELTSGPHNQNISVVLQNLSCHKYQSMLYRLCR